MSVNWIQLRGEGILSLKIPGRPEDCNEIESISRLFYGNWSKELCEIGESFEEFIRRISWKTDNMKTYAISVVMATKISKMIWKPAKLSFLPQLDRQNGCLVLFYKSSHSIPRLSMVQMFIWLLWKNWSIKWPNWQCFEVIIIEVGGNAGDVVSGMELLFFTNLVAPHWSKIKEKRTHVLMKIEEFRRQPGHRIDIFLLLSPYFQLQYCSDVLFQFPRPLFQEIRVLNVKKGKN